MALPEPRLQFRMPRIVKLIDISKKYIDCYGEDELIETIKDTLVAYLDFHKESNFELEKEFYLLIKEFVGKKKRVQVGGLKKITKLESYK